MQALHAFLRKYPDIDLLDLAARVRISRNLLVETLEQQRDQIKDRGIAHTTSARA